MSGTQENGGETLSSLCEANYQSRVHTLLYIRMINNNGQEVTGHVDLADRVSKVLWLEKNILLSVNKNTSVVLERWAQR